MGLVVVVVAEVTSYRRDDAPTLKRGLWALEEADVRREAWYARLEAWKTAEGEGGADMVGEDEVSMSRLHGASNGLQGAITVRAKVGESDARSGCPIPS
jgi:hypothetical protein